MSYYREYLINLLQEVKDPRRNDSEFIESRAELAQDEFDRLTRMGEPGFAAHELAMETLLAGVDV